MDRKNIIDEIFYQAAHDGIPSHWVVTYLTKTETDSYYRKDAAYFETEKEAHEFANNL